MLVQSVSCGMLTGVIALGLGLLLVGGVWQLSRVGLNETRLKRKHLVSEDVTVLSPEDFRRPERLVENGAKLRNAFAMTLEVLIIAGSVIVAGVVFTASGVPPSLLVVTGATLVVGVVLVGRGLYVRSGLYRPTLETPEDYRRSLARRVDDEVAREFAGLHGALSAARGSEDDLDETTVCVLAGARAGHTPEKLVAWGETVAAGDAEQFGERVDQLAEAGLITVERGQLRPHPSVAGTDRKQMATVAESAL